MADASFGEARELDLDTGAGVDLVEVTGIVVAASGGAILVGGIAETINVLGVGGGVASGVADLGDPVKIGGRAQATAPTAVTAGQRANAWFGLNGQQVATLADIGGNLVTVTANRLIVDASGVAVPITDNAGSLTVDAPVGTPAFVRLSDGAAALIGQKAMAASLPVVIASDQSNVGTNNAQWGGTNVVTGGIAGVVGVGGPTAADAAIAANPVTTGGRASQATPTAMSADGDVVNIWLDRSGRQVVAAKSGTGTNTSVGGSATSVTVLAANTARLGATVYNDSTAILYLILGSTAASTTNYTVQMGANAYYEVPYGYTGQLTGIWASATGNARVTEVTS